MSESASAMLTSERWPVPSPESGGRPGARRAADRGGRRLGPSRGGGTSRKSGALKTGGDREPVTPLRGVVLAKLAQARAALAELERDRELDSTAVQWQKGYVKALEEVLSLEGLSLRRHPRRPTAIPTEVARILPETGAPGPRAKGAIRDLSLGGCRLTPGMELSVGELIDLSFRLPKPGTPVVVEGWVRRADRIEGELSVGVEFQGVFDEIVAALEAFLALPRQVTIALVGGGEEASALLELILDWQVAEVAVVVDARPDAPALARANALGIPTAAHPLEVFAYPVDLVLEATGQPGALEDLLRVKPPGVEVIGAVSLRFFWDLLQDLRTTREQLVQTERLRGFGQLASGVAHDFNNLLGAILGRTELLLRRERLDPRTRGELQIIAQAALDGARAVERIWDFTRPRPPRPYGPVNLAQVLREAREFTRPRWETEAQAAGITYEVRVDAEPVPPIAGDPAELREAFTNLLLNALEAMPRGGPVRLTVAQESDRVRVIVEDAGCGMSEEVQPRVSETFFTTKGPQGTGLGLSLVWGIVQRHGGEIALDTAEGKGTTFTLSFPIRAPSIASEAPAPRPWSSRRGRILIIDDDPQVRAVLREVLEGQGHRVVEAADGPDGLARCEAEQFDLAITDLVLPRMSGWEVAATLKRRAQLPVGLITGWTDQVEPADAVATLVDFVLTKPFQLEEILRCVAEVLATGGEAP